MMVPGFHSGVMRLSSSMFPTPEMAVSDSSIAECLIGVGSDAGSFVVQGFMRDTKKYGSATLVTPSAYHGGIEYMLPCVVYDGAEMRWNKGVVVDGHVVYSSGSYNLWFCSAYDSWVLTRSAPGVIPDEYHDYVNDKDGGDWFCLVSFTSGGVELDPRGSAKEDEPGEAEVKPESLSGSVFKRDPSSKTHGPYGSLIGKYVEVKDGDSDLESGSEPAYEIGVRSWEGPDGTQILRSSAVDATGHYTYGPIHFSKKTEGEGWVIGTPGSTSPWWTGDEPGEGDVEFTFAGPDGYDGDKSARTYKYLGLTFGPGTADVYVGQVATWT